MQQQQPPRIVRDYFQKGAIETVVEEIKRKQLAAAYCRVSTKMDAQQDSLITQTKYYTDYIESKSEEYEMVGIFADKGTSGLAMRRRKEFNRMIAMALNGEIDIIFVKSISRYGRNVIDILSTTRMLREKGVTIVFEKEQINSMDPKCDMMLSILSTLSEDESRSISTNVRWTKDKLFEQGIVRINFSALYGYRGGGKGEVTVCEEEAELVRAVYHRFVAGWTLAELKRFMQESGAITPMGKTNWDKSTIQGMLTQEKYMGDVLLRKKFKKDFMQLYPQKNTGQVPQKYIENNHPPIVTRELYAAVQAEFERRNSLRSSLESGRGRYSGKYPFSNLIICAECGFRFRRHNYRSRIQKEHLKIDPVWTCYNHLKRSSLCSQLPIKEDYLERLFDATLSDLIKDKNKILAELEIMIAESLDGDGAYDENEIASIDKEIEILQGKVLELNQQRRRQEIGQDDYKKKTEKCTARLEELFDKRDKAMEVSGNSALQTAKLTSIKEFFNEERTVDTFDKNLPQQLLEAVVIKSRTDITFEFKNGLSIKAKNDAVAEVIIPKTVADANPTLPSIKRPRDDNNIPIYIPRPELYAMGVAAIENNADDESVLKEQLIKEMKEADGDESN